MGPSGPVQVSSIVDIHVDFACFLDTIDGSIVSMPASSFLPSHLSLKHVYHNLVCCVHYCNGHRGTGILMDGVFHKTTKHTIQDSSGTKVRGRGGREKRVREEGERGGWERRVERRVREEGERGG